jgi:carnitine-CoA ligase
MRLETLKMYWSRVTLVFRMVRSLVMFMVDEHRRGTLAENLRSFIKARGVAVSVDMSHSDLLEEKAANPKLRDKPFLYFGETTFTYGQMDENANRLANFLESLGGGPGVGLAIMMKNSPRWLDVFYGLEKLGMYTIPVNVALRHEQLVYIIDNSEASILVIDHDLLHHYRAVTGSLPGITTVIVNTEGAPEGFEVPDDMESLDSAYSTEVGTTRPSVLRNPEDLCIIMYTSGTTGLPKGVVYRYNSTNVKALSVITRMLTSGSDVAYTCYPLFHANALFLSVTTSMHAGGSVAVATKFSASGFWDDVRRYGATTFNGLGAVMPILMKQPPGPNDGDNKVRLVISSGCPAELWRDFEKRFGLTIYEGYGAVDGGSTVLTNFGTAPPGSMGKPIGGKIRVVDAEGRDCPAHVPGELICEVGKKKSSVEYFKDAEATNDKVRDGWIYTGDLVYQDESGFLYFVGRNTESMRCRGENVSAYEVESAVLRYPCVLECAVYAVPSELAEDEIMVTLVPVDGETVEPTVLRDFLSERLAKFAVPRYYRAVSALPKTETHRIIKKDLESLGVTPDTVDTMAGDPAR